MDFLFGSAKSTTSQTQILCKKIDIVTSPHSAEQQWDLIMQIVDGLNADSNRAKRVLAHLKRILEKAIATSSDNQQLQNCILVIDALSRNGNDNVLSVIHTHFLPVLSKFIISAESASTKFQSLLIGAEDSKTCKDRVLELMLDWQSADECNIDQNKYPNFRATFVHLKQNGAAFHKIIAERERLRKQQEAEEKNRRLQQQPEQQESEVAEQKQFNDAPTYDNPWSNKNMAFGRWYKAKLKADLSKLIDLICMTQDIISMKNTVDGQVMCMELREANKRLITIMLRTHDAAAMDCLLQLVTINSSLLDCYKKLTTGQKFVVPGVSRQFLHIITKSL
mmetsp:Transcript_22395/g.35931  ORF Transcript_22395/g.35931 Transcript_22395/m.35931 type:complete len:336 (+) Transcript_22395:42-1049(+)